MHAYRWLSVQIAPNLQLTLKSGEEGDSRIAWWQIDALFVVGNFQEVSNLYLQVSAQDFQRFEIQPSGFLMVEARQSCAAQACISLYIRDFHPLFAH